MIYYGKQQISEQDIEAVINVLQSDFLTQGPAVAEFEQQVKTLCQTQHAIAVNSATSALHIACLALGLGKGDILWTSPISFVASANCALYCQAQVDFVDIDPHTFNLSVSALEHKLIQAKKNNSLPKIVIPVHFAGLSCDMQAIHALSQQYGFNIIEDASHAIGGGYQDKPIGHGQYSDICIFSFHPVKIITSGEGGMALTRNVALANTMRQLRSHGVTRDKEQMTQPIEDHWYYEQQQLGFNYRLSDIHAALGSSQLQRIEQFINKRKQIAQFYIEQLLSLPLSIQTQSKDTKSSYHLFVIRLNDSHAHLHRTLFEQLKLKNIVGNLHYIPIHLHPYYKKLGFKHGDFPQAEHYYQQAISIPIYPSLEPQHQHDVVNVIKQVLS